MDISNELFAYENDFKESHVKHLKRPALVTIKKPLLSNQEMEDVLTRLLNLHVPAILDSRASNTGLGRRAFLVDKGRYLERHYGTEEEQKKDEPYANRGIFEINYQQNVYLSKYVPDTVNPWRFRINPDVIHTTDRAYEKTNHFSTPENSNSGITFDKDDFSKTHIPRAGDVGYTIIESKLDPSGEIVYVTTEKTAASCKFFNWNLLKNYNPYTGGYAYSGNVLKPVTDHNWFSLWLLSDADQEFFQVDKKGESSRKEFVDRKDLFNEDGFLYYKGYKKQVLFDPKDPKGISHDMDEAAAKRAFGYIPKEEKHGYLWEFSCPKSTQVAVLTDTYFSSSTIDEAFIDMCRTILQIYDAYPKNQETDQLKELYNFIHIFNTNQPAVLQRKHKYINNVRVKLKALDFEKPVITKQIITSGPAVTVNYDNSVAVNDAITVKKAIEFALTEFEEYEKRGYHKDSTAISLLRPRELVSREIEAAKDAAACRKYIKPKFACNLSIGQFKKEYYAILLKKIEDKYNKLKYFIETTKIIELSNRDSYDSLLAYVNSPKTNKEYTDLTFVQAAEGFLFNPFSGFYITSYSPTQTDTVAPLWNSSIDETNRELLQVKIGGLSFDDTAASIIINNQNKDVSSISIDRVTSGMSYASLVLKNDKEKYSYPFNKQEYLSRTNFIIEPMDEISIYLPTTEIEKKGAVNTNDGKLEPVFSGIISNVTAKNDGGMHSILIKADCMKKLLTINRTNTKPSVTRNESGNKQVQAFEMPTAFYYTVEKWMTYLFVISLTNFGTQLSSITTSAQEGYDKQLFTTTTKPVVEKRTHVLKEKQDVVQKEIISEQLTYPISKYSSTDILEKENPTFAFSGMIGLAKIGSEAVEHITMSKVQHIPVEGVKTTTIEKTIEVTAPKEYSGSVNKVVGYYTDTTFEDPLLTYLWYKNNTVNFPKEEQQKIETNLKKVMEDYIYTVVPDEEQGALSYTKGCKPYKDLLRQGKRASYYVYKTRDTNLDIKLKQEFPNTDEVRYVSISAPQTSLSAPQRICVAKIVGTAQPAYTLKTSNFDIQFSSWKTNNEIINDIAQKFNFLYYTDKNGIVLFTPYNFDLTTLSTENNTKSLDTVKMLTYRSKRDLQNEDNVQILKDQYMTSYIKTDSDREIINWLTLNGSWAIDGANEVDKFTKAIVQDPVLIKKFGYRTGKNISILGIQDEQSLQLYGLSYLDRKNKRYRSANTSLLFDARMDINLPYYVPSDEIVYYCESMRVHYTAGATCTAELGLTYGRKPLMNIEEYVVDAEMNQYISGNKMLNFTNKFKQSLDNLFVKQNVIKPSTWAQYRKFLDPSTQPTQKSANKQTDLNSKMAINASICCFNGLLWDNVAGIAFEELLYNYGWLSTGFGTGIASAIGSNEKLIESLSKYMVLGNDISRTTESIRALNTFFIRVPAISNSKVAPQLDTKQYIYSDLAVPGILDPDAIKR